MLCYVMLCLLAVLYEFYADPAPEDTFTVKLHTSTTGVYSASFNMTTQSNYLNFTVKSEVYDDTEGGYTNVTTETISCKQTRIKHILSKFFHIYGICDHSQLI